MTSQAGRFRTGAAGLLLVALTSGCAATGPAAAGPTSAGTTPGGQPSSTAAPPATVEFGLVDPVVRRAPGIVVVTPQGAVKEAGRYLRLARRAERRVRAIVPGAHSRLIVVAPATESSMEALLGVGSGAYADTAAVSVVPSGADAPRVYLNPAQFERYNGQGRLILLTHEATHVLTGVVDNTAMPLWLVEGFADYVALHDIHLPLATTAKQVLAQVRRHGPPARLPTAADFAAAGNDDDAFGAEYEASWLACRLIAHRAGQARLVALYQAVKRGEPIGTAFRRYAGTSVAAFTRLWQQRLSDWSHPGAA